MKTLCAARRGVAIVKMTLDFQLCFDGPLVARAVSCINLEPGDVLKVIHEERVVEEQRVSTARLGSLGSQGLCQQTLH